MIRIDLAMAVSIFVALIVGAFFFLWIARKWARTKAREKGRDLVQCPYCGNVFIDSSRKGIVICLICKSYVEVRHEDRQEKI